MTIDNKGTLADFDLMFQGNISLLWIQECRKKGNEDRKVGELLKEFQEDYGDIDIYNKSVLIMASYLFFVYAKEKDFIGRDYSFVDTSKFKIHKCKYDTPDNDYICRKVRNALAHSRVHIDENGLITFEDYKLRGTKKINYFNCTISYIEFGNFIYDFMFGLRDRYFSNRV